MSVAPAGSPSVRDPGARAAIAAIASAFTELAADVAGGDPLGWPGYDRQRERAFERSGERESVLCGEATIGGVEAIVIAFDFRFMGGSMGEAAGRRITRALARATAERRPVVSLVASGGCRMQEGMRALIQLQRIAAAAQRARAAGVPHVTVLRGATTGGVWASLAGGADVVLALPGTPVAFAGHRVRGADAPDDPAFTAEGQLAGGHVDLVVEEADVADTLALLLALLAGGEPAPAEVPRALGRTDPPPDGWAAVQRARAPERPRARAYLDDHFEARVTLGCHGAGDREPGLLWGVGRRGGRGVAFAAQTGTATTPAEFRAAARLVRLADRLGLPVLTLVDTPGALNDASGERDGVGPAISDLFGAVAAARVPITTLVIGEGGSGGALALAAADNVWMTPDSYFAVIVPEAAAAILKLAPEEAPAVAGRLTLRPQELVELGIVRGIAAARDG